MIIFVIIYHFIIIIVMALIILFQFIHKLLKLLTGKSNSKIEPFSRQLVVYIFEIFLFLTYNTEEKTFPFSDWPSSNKNIPLKKISEPVEIVAREDKDSSS